jgi:hypothetical protein
VAATYGASVTTKIPWQLPVAIAFGAVLMGVAWIMNLGVNEEICFDRWPWWGPPEDPNVYTSCSGHIYERRQAGYGWFGGPK